MSVRLLTVKISQWASENLCCYRKNSVWPGLACNYVHYGPAKSGERIPSLAGGRDQISAQKRGSGKQHQGETGKKFFQCKAGKQIWIKGSRVHLSSVNSVPWHFSPVRWFSPVSFNLKTLWLREDRSLHCVAATALFWVAFSKRLYTCKIKGKQFPLLTVSSIWNTLTV